MNPRPNLALATLLPTLMAGLSAMAGNVESRFNAGTEGWQAIEFLDNDTNYGSIFNGPADVTWDQGDGQPPPCVRFTEPGSWGQTFYFAAPLKFLGNQGDKATLDWFIKTSPGGSWQQPDVVLWGLVAGSRLVLVNSVPPQANTNWQQFSVDLGNPNDWHVGTSTGPLATAIQLADALSALEGLFIRGEFRSGVDASWLDTVVLTSEAPKSYFDTDAEGWQAIEFLDNDTNYSYFFNGPADVIWDPNDGQPPPCVRFTEPGSWGQTFYFAAPPKFLGDQSDRATLDWFIRTDPGGSWQQPDVVLWGQVGGARLVLVNSVPNQAGTSWQRVSVNLRNPNEWHVGTSVGPAPTNAELKAVLGSLEGLFIRGEFRSGVDTSWLDNVRLTTVGDLNCDNLVDFGDIDPFVIALSDPDGYSVMFPDCNILNGDCDGNGYVDFDDINPFIALLSGAPPFLISYSFDTDAAGWRVVGVPDNGPFDPPTYSAAAQWDPNAGDPNGCIWWHDTWTGTTYFDAPDALVESLDQAYGAHLTWDIRVTGNSGYSSADVVLVSPSLVLVNSSPPQANANWQTFGVQFLPTAGWTKYPSDLVPTEAEFQSVLTTLSALLVRAEYAGYDTAYLDNVVVAETSP